MWGQLDFIQWIHIVVTFWRMEHVETAGGNQNQESRSSPNPSSISFMSSYIMASQIAYPANPWAPNRKYECPSNAVSRIPLLGEGDGPTFVSPLVRLDFA